MLRSLSCSQSIRQRIRHRTVAVYFNLQWDSQILVHRSQGQSNLTSFHHCVKLRFSNTQCCQALERRSRLHSVVTNLRYQSRCAFSRDWVASKVAVHEDCDFVHMFLSSKSQRCLGLSHQIPCLTFQWDKIEFASLARSLGQMFRCFSKTNLSWARYESLMHADRYRVASSFFRIGLRLPSNTNLSCSFSRGVLTASVFVLHLDSLMMSGACLKSGSISTYCPV